MMKRLLLALIFVCFASVAQAHSTRESFSNFYGYKAVGSLVKTEGKRPIKFAQLSGGFMFPGPGTPHSSGGGCSQATTFLARTSLTGSDVTNYTNLICGMVTDGLITGDLSTTGCGSLFDVLYILATANATDALKNICGTNFTGNNTGLTFTAYSGFTAVSGQLLQTNFNPSTATSPNYTQNSAHISEWNLVNSGTTSIDATAGTGENTIFASGSINSRVNDNPESSGFSASDFRGHILGNRSSSTARQLYQNASTTLIGGTTATYPSTPSQAVNNTAFSLLSLGDHTGAMASIGASLNSTQVTNFYNRLRTYMTAVGVP
jgi:hypothetical protein